ncbi:hypothetical protein PoB_004965800 [Plakobranchus ocellatus]|uniref:Uncharacterized protein n=1 Tax=Plakobranchus ocellatus TaxID=259542 RepID=A0AAV4BU76_9GAST|nr:hypothetical protein PoB_004965800 [Plakobranchus ocellatus]
MVEPLCWTTLARVSAIDNMCNMGNSSNPLSTLSHGARNDVIHHSNLAVNLWFRVANWHQSDQDSANRRWFHWVKLIIKISPWETFSTLGRETIV